VKNKILINTVMKCKYAVILLWLTVFVSTVSTFAEESIQPAVDTSIITQHVVDTVLTSSQLIPVDTISMKSTTDTASTRIGLTPTLRKINYTGVTLSAFVPGSGQVYQSRYVMGGLFLAAEATAVGFAVYWSDEADVKRSNAKWYRNLSDTLYRRSEAVGIDSTDHASLLSEAGRYSVIADETDFEAREARHTVYNALAWAAGIHLYNVLDALEAGGLTPRGHEKSPTTAGLLAAVPFLGLGQLYNERPSKAGIMAMTQVGLALTAYNQHRLMSIASDKYNQMRDTTSIQYAYRADHLNYWKSNYDNAFSGRNTYLWLSLAAYLYSLFDAVVDAYLSDFNAKIDLGTDLSVAPGGGGASFSVTVGLKRPR